MARIAAAGTEIRTPFGAVIAIPARDEVHRLPRCLLALADQRGADLPLARVAVVVLANNCTDDTAAVAHRLAPWLPYRLLVREVELPVASAHAGGARGRAMGAAALLLGPAGVLLTTDADAVPEPGWLAANLAAIATGADAVAGTIMLDAAECAALPSTLQEQLRLEAGYGLLLERIASLIDPEPENPWPRHPWQSGASMALTCAAWHRIGGLPRVASGEDRALFAAVRRAGLAVRQSPAARVTVSCRIEGRAAAGMAETLRQRLALMTATADDRLESVRRAALRLSCRRRFRLLRDDASVDPDFAPEVGVPPEVLEDALRRDTFWAGWEVIEAAAPGLRRHPLPLHALHAETRAGRALIAMLARRSAADRAGREDGVRAAAAGPGIPSPP